MKYYNPSNCGRSIRINDIFICEDEMTPCPHCYNGSICAIEKSEKWLDMFKEIINKEEKVK